MAAHVMDAARRLAGALSGAIALYGHLVGAQARSQMQYRLSFLMTVAGAFAGNIIDFAAVAIILQRVPRLAGWSLGEVALLYGMSGLSFSVAELFAASLDNFDRFIVAGTFDRVLTRPLGALFQAMTEDFRLHRFGRLAQGVAVFAIAQQLLAIPWSAARVAVLVLALVGGFGIYFSIFVLGAVFCFWTVQGKEATHVLTYGGDFFASYPLDLYRGWLRRFFTFIVPLAFVNYYPALYLLGRADPLGLPLWTQLLSPVVASIMALVAWRAWAMGMRRYQSTGT